MKRDADASFADYTFAPSSGSRPRLEPEYLCALSMRVMLDPVMIADPAHPPACFDRDVLIDFIAVHGVSPCTGQPLRPDMLLPNSALKSLIKANVWDHMSASPANKRPRLDMAAGIGPVHTHVASPPPPWAAAAITAAAAVSSLPATPVAPAPAPSLAPAPAPAPVATGAAAAAVATTVATPAAAPVPQQQPQPQQPQQPQPQPQLHQPQQQPQQQPRPQQGSVCGSPGGGGAGWGLAAAGCSMPRLHALPAAAPQRPYAPACLHFMAHGICDRGHLCAYHHPTSHALLLTDQELPWRPDAPICQHYQRTGRCGFGIRCRAHHPPAPGAAANGGSSGAAAGAAAGARAEPRPRWGDQSNGAPHAAASLAPPPAQPRPPPPRPQPHPAAQEPRQERPPHAKPPGVGVTHTYDADADEGELHRYVFPQRPDSNPCRHYCLTGFCCHGADCRYDHPEEAAVWLNEDGYPHRPDAEEECYSYAYTGYCLYGPRCMRHHPLRPRPAQK
ncbi:hypothetical protein HXX76_008391 [Chlamydomonas incerta]|uniref:C3H1-type domain-containing protein n=1 Tax=Chlamydomonas incerta TaxID=51695 RepID=A0A835T820_CHLIN|nr:hypothetical protein HXX76_008391 [Chlamydomonas incerta]|eukprot:KAG2433325.1 hypothetical protein HXX76_008391 [Chlamydomonas incerta]